MKVLIVAYLFVSSIAVAKEPFEVERDLWLKAHNDERELAGTKPLIWDMDLKRKAKKWALHLTKECKKLKHSPNGKDVGENLAGSSGRKHLVSMPVSWWIKEKSWYVAEDNSCHAPSGKSCLHYTQVVSRRSERLGCAKAVCEGPGNKTFYVCNYAPHGNLRGVHPLKGG